MPKSKSPKRRHSRRNEARLVRLLLRRKLAVATAESCTGGLIAHLITNVPGASEIFRGAVVAYDNDIKRKFLGVRATSLKNFTAVSRTVAREMADGARRRFATNFALSTTGVAGPGGGTKKTPVGTVYIGLSTTMETIVIKRHFPFSRSRFKTATAREALALLLSRLPAD